MVTARSLEAARTKCEPLTRSDVTKSGTNCALTVVHFQDVDCSKGKHSPITLLAASVIASMLSPMSMSSCLATAIALIGVSLLFRIGSALHRKLRIARGLAPLSGPRGVFLLGNIPVFARNRDRIYDFLVCRFCSVDLKRDHGITL